MEIVEGFHHLMHAEPRRRFQFQSSNMQDVLEKCNELIPEVSYVDFDVNDVPFVSLYVK